MIVAQRERQDLARRPLDHLCCRPPVLRWVLEQLVFEDLAELALPGILSGQALDPLHHELKRPLPEVEHMFTRHLEATGQLGVGIRHPLPISRQRGISLVDHRSVRHVHLIVSWLDRQSAGMASPLLPPGRPVAMAWLPSSIKRNDLRRLRYRRDHLAGRYRHSSQRLTLSHLANRHLARGPSRDAPARSGPRPTKRRQGRSQRYRPSAAKSTNMAVEHTAGGCLARIVMALSAWSVRRHSFSASKPLDSAAFFGEAGRNGANMLEQQATRVPFPKAHARDLPGMVPFCLLEGGPGGRAASGARGIVSSSYESSMPSSGSRS